MTQRDLDNLLKWGEEERKRFEEEEIKKKKVQLKIKSYLSIFIYFFQTLILSIPLLSKIVISIYLLWVLLNLYLLTSPSLLNMGLVVSYDITDFIFYSIAPIIIYVIIKLFTTKDKSNE